jgi:hypothetical protein
MSHDDSSKTHRSTSVQIGDRFGRLTIESEATSKGGLRMFICNCDCGTSVVRPLKSLRNGTTSSCGCLRRDMVAAKNHKHGMRTREGSSPPEYFIWKRMRTRCNDPRDRKWPDYGGRGITIDPRWDDFTVFLSDVGPRPSPKHSIDRINNNGNYEPGNVRWATASQQSRNKRNNVRISFDGEDLTIAEWAERRGMSAIILAQRIRRGWSAERALTEPVVFGKNQYGC